ncbi:MAG: hypothetical protein ABIT07_00330 [Ferruginibacter sp.]
MPRLIFFLILLGFSSLAFSQRTIPSNQTNGVLPIQISASTNQTNLLASPFEGQRFRVRADNAVDGSPLLFETGRKGEVVLVNNEKYQVDEINLDASNNIFIYSKNDTMYEFFDSIIQIKIHPDNNTDQPGEAMIFRNDINPQGGFVQLLVSGKITIFQKYLKKPEGENYSNGIVNNTRKYVVHKQQNALVNNKVIPIKYTSADLGELTADKKDELQAFVKLKGLKPKKENDFLTAILYYNSISKSAL